MKDGRKPPRWRQSDDAIKAVQLAFDVEQIVFDAIRVAAFENRISTSDQIRQLLQLPVSSRPQRPRLTVSLTPQDYTDLGDRFGIPSEDRLAIKEQVTQELIRFAKVRQKS